MEKTVYVSPRCEETEISLEGVVLSMSIPDVGDGGDVFELLIED